MSEFNKADAGKPRPDLTPHGFLLEMGRVFAFGAAKYGEGNWSKCDDPLRYEAAALRHLLAFIDGERVDPDSGLSTLAHCACSIAMRWGLDQLDGFKERKIWQRRD